MAWRWCLPVVGRRGGGERRGRWVPAAAGVAAPLARVGVVVEPWASPITFSPFRLFVTTNMKPY